MSIRVLTDIGGTFARFVQFEDGAFVHTKKYEAAKFDTLEDALTQYCKNHDIDNKGEILIATAAYEDSNDEWRFVNKNTWVISAKSLKKAGWKLTAILNDFAASTWGLVDLGPLDLQVLHEGETSDRPQCLTGPGTGLGLGYLTKAGETFHVQRTHGGHMIASPATEEQWLVMKTVQRQKDNNEVTVFEHLVSGPGLLNIYNAYSLICGKEPKIDRVEDIMTILNDRITMDSIRLFNEFLGLHARSAVITAHAYGGLTLTGGVLKRLNEQDLFDYGQFRKYFTIDGVASVTADLEKTPINHFIGSHLAMRGLLNFTKYTS
ncbi:MAG: glucokinase [Pseudomonadota bacterium]